MLTIGNDSKRSSREQRVSHRVISTHQAKPGFVSRQSLRERHTGLGRDLSVRIESGHSKWKESA
jgi:hypothetical protein